MKRIVSFVLAMMLLFTCIESFAEEEDSEKSKQLKNLNLMSLYYTLLPDDFDADMIMQTYLSFMIYMNLASMDLYYVSYAMKEGTNVTAKDRMQQFAVSSAKLTDLATDSYIDWLEGNMTDTQYAEVLMMLVDGVIENDGK